MTSYIHACPKADGQIAKSTTWSQNKQAKKKKDRTDHKIWPIVNGSSRNTL